MRLTKTEIMPVVSLASCAAGEHLVVIDWLGIRPPFRAFGDGGGCGVFHAAGGLSRCSFVAHVVLPAIRVPGYVINPETGEPRNYRLNGILVYVIALVVWWFELTGMPRDWFYESSLYAVVWRDGVHPNLCGDCGVQVSGARW